MRLTSIPGPRDVWAVLDRSAGSVEQLLAAVPRVTALLAQAERLVSDATGLVARIEATRASADALVERTEETRAGADRLLAGAGDLVPRLAALLDSLEPSLTRLQPTLERLAETTHPHEVDAIVGLVDRLPHLLDQVQGHVIPMLDNLVSVAPDVHDLLDVSRELNEMLAKLPGMGRVKKRIDERQEVDGRG